MHPSQRVPPGGLPDVTILGDVGFTDRSRSVPCRGTLEPSRLLWALAGLIYAAGLAAITVLPPLGDAECSNYPPGLLRSPERVPDQPTQIAKTEGVLSAMDDWGLREMLLNVARLIPFGVILRRLFHLPPFAVVLAGLGVSLFNKTTQLTSA